MKAEEKVRDAASAQGLKTEHERIKAEIEAREDEFSKVVESGGNMIEEQHYASTDVEERVNKVRRNTTWCFVWVWYTNCTLFVMEVLVCCEEGEVMNVLISVIDIV